MSSDRVFNVLFLCTGNSARSILAEAILRQEGGVHFRAYSAGSLPKGQVNPLAIDTLERLGCSPEGLRSKSWEEFEDAESPAMDFVFTVCDNAAGEVCPIWPGHPLTAHWGIEDPSDAEGDAVARTLAFATAARYLRSRIRTFTALPFGRLDRTALRTSLAAIGADEGSTEAARAK